jgi:hypothetical protein
LKYEPFVTVKAGATVVAFADATTNFGEPDATQVVAVAEVHASSWMLYPIRPAKSVGRVMVATRPEPELAIATEGAPSVGAITDADELAVDVSVGEEAFTSAAPVVVAVTVKAPLYGFPAVRLSALIAMLHDVAVTAVQVGVAPAYVETVYEIEPPVVAALEDADQEIRTFPVA